MPAMSQDVPLSLFSGTNSELAPVDIPEGVSPDNQDMIFLPGETISRPCLHKLLNSALANTPTIMHVDPYEQANGNPLNLMLDSKGRLWQEDPVNSPGVTAQIGTVTAGARMKQQTAGGVSYMTFHDGLHGIDVPRQYDGTNFDRLTQDGPGAAVTVADLASAITVTSITAAAAVNIARISQLGNINTINTAAPHGLTEGTGLYLAVSAGSQYNGFYQVLQVIDSVSFTTAAQTTGLGPATTGTIQSTFVTVVTAAPHGLQLKGDYVVISGNASANYNNNAQWTDPFGVNGQNSASWQTTTLTPTSFLMAIIVPVAGAQAGGTANIGGQISVGEHRVVCSFQLRDGSITKPGPYAAWICGGNKQAVVSNLPIGPPNCIARVLSFTGAGGGRYFMIPNDVLAPNQINIADGAKKTVIADNVTTSVIVDFSDNTLFASEGIDITGNNLFALVTLAPCLGVFLYGSRLWIWGEYNKVQRLLNMGFEGGTVAANNPLGWTVATAGGALVTSGVDFGVGWQITGDGTANPKGQILQSAALNINNLQILDPLTQYTFYVWAVASANNLAGNLIATLSSASSGFFATATIAVNTVTTLGAFLKANFTLATPSVIPSDMTLTVHEVGMPNGATITIDEMMMVFTLKPYRDELFRASYVNQFTSFDGVTGSLGSAEDTSKIMCAGELRSTMYFQTQRRLHQTRDNGTTEPGDDPGWTVDGVANVGAMSVDSMSPVSKGEEWFFTLSGGPSGLGLYIFDGAGPYKVSQEYQSNFDAINAAAQQFSWVVNDPVVRRVYVGVATGSAGAPNILYVMDYRELDQPGQIGSASAIHISFSGKMIASDLVRKWTRWNLSLNCGSIIPRQSGTQFVVGAGNGSAPGVSPGFGQLYFFDSAKLTDDDYGPMSPYYTTYFFVNHDMEQQMQFGSHRKSFNYLTCRVLGKGNLQITPLKNELTNPDPTLRAQALTSSLTRDIERRLYFTTERAAFKFAVTPVAGQTDVKLDLQKVVVTMQEEMWTPTAGPR